MPCRVGITTRPDERRAEWERRVVGLTNWRIIGEYHSRQKAQAHEERYAQQTGCQAWPGGSDAPGPWYVYRFDYIRERS